MADVIDLIAVVYKWVDQSISFRVDDRSFTRQPCTALRLLYAGLGKGNKTVYYVRSLSGEVKDDCVSCSG
jgi:ribonucleoside-diphosphate reductase alpha chain